MRHLLLTGPFSAGKTSLSIGICTEFAVTLGEGRYLSAIKLVQLAAGVIQPVTRLILPGDFETALMAGRTKPPLAWLAGRRSVWVLGDASQASDWKQLVARLIDIDASAILTIELRGPLEPGIRCLRQCDERRRDGAAQQGFAGLPLGGGVEGFEKLHVAAGEEGDR